MEAKRAKFRSRAFCLISNSVRRSRQLIPPLGCRMYGLLIAVYPRLMRLVSDEERAEEKTSTLCFPRVE